MKASKIIENSVIFVGCGIVVVCIAISIYNHIQTLSTGMKVLLSLPFVFLIALGLFLLNMAPGSSNNTSSGSHDKETVDFLRSHGQLIPLDPSEARKLATSIKRLKLKRAEEATRKEVDEATRARFSDMVRRGREVVEVEEIAEEAPLREEMAEENEKSDFQIAEEAGKDVCKKCETINPDRCAACKSCIDGCAQNYNGYCTYHDD